MYKFADKDHKTVTNLVTGQSGIHPGLHLWEEYQRYVATGGVTEPFDARSPEQIAAENQAKTIAIYQDAVQAAMDKVAGEWGYGCPIGGPGAIGYCISVYRNSLNPRWAAEAAALEVWLHQVWAWALEQQAAILADPSLLPATPEEFAAGMPAPPERPGA